MVNFNTGFLNTNRGAIKILQVIFGIVTMCLLCTGPWNSARRNYSCMDFGYQAGYITTLNLVCLIINTVLLVMNFLTQSTLIKLERLYSLIGTILFIVAFGLFVWLLIQNNTEGRFIAGAVFIGIQMVLFIWDYQILHGQAWNL